MAVHDLLKGREYNRNKAMEGFNEVNDPRIARAVHQGGYADVLLRPTMVGILRCGKMLPPQLNLVIEIEFADATTALWSENAGAHPAGATLSTDFEIQNFRVLASQVVLDSALVESFNRVLLSGRSLVFSYPTVHTQQSSVPNATEAFVAAQLASRDTGISALQASKADAALLASYATNAALSASETTLQSALDAILAELAALQLPGGGVVNAPAWAGFTTWELLRGSNVVRNLHLEAPLSAALANGDDTLSITADCYSVAGRRGPCGCAAGLLHLLTSGHSVGRLPNRNGAGRGDGRRHHGRAAGLLHLLTSRRAVGRLPHGEHTQTHAAIAGALLAYRTPQRWRRTAQPPTRTRRRPRASPPRCSATTPSHK